MAFEGNLMNEAPSSPPRAEFPLKLFVALATFLLSFATITAPAHSAAQNSNPPNSAPISAAQKAKDDIKVGDIANRNGATDEAIADYKAAVIADPSNLDAHTKFLRAYQQKVYAFLTPKKIKTAKKKPTKEQIKAQQEKNQAKRAKLQAKYSKLLLTTYDGWIKRNPQQPMFYWGKAQVLESQDRNADAKAWLQKAIAIDPSCAPPWADLADMAATDGDLAAQRQDAEKALALDPKDDSGVFFNYALTYLTADPAKYRQVVEDRVAKYPDGLELLLALAAENSPTVAEEEAAYEKLYQAYGPKSAKPSDDVSDIMVDLFNLYARTDSAKALAFAQQMQKAEADALAKKAAAENKGQTAGKDSKKADAKAPKPLWESISDFQKSLVDAQSLFAQKKYADALALLDKNALPSSGGNDPLSGVEPTPYDLTKAEALAGSGDNQKAYDSIKTALLPQPDASLEAALATYGAKLGKTPAQIDQDVWQSRESKAKAMTPFDLKQYVTDKDVKLADFRGQIVLVNFWFPG
jgi:hypothetical protein